MGSVHGWISCLYASLHTCNSSDSKSTSWSFPPYSFPIHYSNQPPVCDHLNYAFTTASLSKFRCIQSHGSTSTLKNIAMCFHYGHQDVHFSYVISLHTMRSCQSINFISRTFLKLGTGNLCEMPSRKCHTDKEQFNIKLYFI